MVNLNLNDGAADVVATSFGAVDVIATSYGAVDVVATSYSMHWSLQALVQLTWSLQAIDHTSNCVSTRAVQVSDVTAQFAAVNIPRTREAAGGVVCACARPCTQ